MEQKFIKLNEIKLGYCQNCGSPNFVGLFEVSHWKHNFFLCSICLRNFAVEIDEKGKELYYDRSLHSSGRADT